MEDKFRVSFDAFNEIALFFILKRYLHCLLEKLAHLIVAEVLAHVKVPVRLGHGTWDQPIRLHFFEFPTIIKFFNGLGP